MGMSIARPDVDGTQVLTSSMVLHVTIEMIFGTKGSVLLTALPATNKCAVGRL